MNFNIDPGVINDRNGHKRVNEFIGVYPIKEAVRKQNEKIAAKNIAAIYKWFWKGT